MVGFSVERGLNPEGNAVDGFEAFDEGDISKVGCNLVEECHDVEGNSWPEQSPPMINPAGDS